MNTIQRLILIAYAVLVAGMMLYPPAIRHVGAGSSMKVSGGSFRVSLSSLYSGVETFTDEDKKTSGFRYHSLDWTLLHAQLVTSTLITLALVAAFRDNRPRSTE